MEYTVRLRIDTSYLDKWGAAALALSHELPIIVELLFTWQYLNNTESPPKVWILIDCCGEGVKALEDEWEAM